MADLKIQNILSIDKIVPHRTTVKANTAKRVVKGVVKQYSKEIDISEYVTHEIRLSGPTLNESKEYEEPEDDCIIIYKKPGSHRREIIHGDTTYEVVTWGDIKTFKNKDYQGRKYSPITRKVDGKFTYFVKLVK